MPQGPVKMVSVSILKGVSGVNAHLVSPLVLMVLHVLVSFFKQLVGCI